MNVKEYLITWNKLQAFIDYKNGIIPQIQIKYTQGTRRVHLATQRCPQHLLWPTKKIQFNPEQSTLQAEYVNEKEQIKPKKPEEKYTDRATKKKGLNHHSLSMKG